MEKIVTVTLEDIQNGKPNNAYDCPIALACQRLFKVGREVEVTNDSVALGLDGSYVIFDLPGEAQRFIERFDLEHPEIEPFMFTMVEREEDDA